MVVQVLKAFWFFELLFPLWGIVLTILLSKKGVAVWKAWGLVSTFFVLEVYLVGIFLGYNLGIYFFALISSVPSIIYENITNTGPVSQELDAWFWILPPLVLIVIPTLILYLMNAGCSNKWRSQS